jgi:hypothetical protein
LLRAQLEDVVHLRAWRSDKYVRYFRQNWVDVWRIFTSSYDVSGLSLLVKYYLDVGHIIFVATDHCDQVVGLFLSSELQLKCSKV